MLFLFRSASKVEKRIHSKFFRKFWEEPGYKGTDLHYCNWRTPSSPLVVYLVYNAYKNVIRWTEVAKWPQDHPSSISLSVTWLKESTLGRLTNLTYLWPSDQPACASVCMGIFNVQLCKLCLCRWMGIFMHARADALFDCEQLGCARTAMCAIVHLFCSHCVRVMIKLCTDCVPEAVLASQIDLTHWSLVSLVQLLLCSMFIIWITVRWSQKAPFFCHSFSSSVSTPPIFASHHRSCWQRRVGGSDNQESSPLVDHMTTDRCLIASPESFLLYSAFTSTFHRFATLEMLSLFYCAIWITMIQIQSL